MSAFGKLFGSGSSSQTTTTDYLNEDQILRGQRTADEALTAAQRMGAYQGDYYAGLNDTQLGAINRTTDFVNTNSNLGQNMISSGQNMMTQGQNTGANAQAIFDRAMSYDSNAAREAAMAEATGERTQGLIDAALRDTTTQLTESTLPGLQQDITSVGGRNSSRAGALEANAISDAQDRMADVSSQIRSDAYNSALNDDYRNRVSNDQLALSGNSQLGTAYDRGMGTVQTGLDTEAGLTNAQLMAGGALQADNQARLDADRMKYNDLRMDGFNVLNAYNQGIGGPIVSGQTTTADSGAGIFQRFGSGMKGLADGLGSIAQIGSMASGNPAAFMSAAGG